MQDGVLDVGCDAVLPVDDGVRLRVDDDFGDALLALDGCKDAVDLRVADGAVLRVLFEFLDGLDVEISGFDCVMLIHNLFVFNCL